MLVGKISPKGTVVPLIFPHLDVFSQEKHSLLKCFISEFYLPRFFR